VAALAILRGAADGLAAGSPPLATWHRLDLITAVPVEHHGVRDAAAGQRTPTSAQIVAAGRAPATAPPGQPPEQQP